MKEKGVWIGEYHSSYHSSVVRLVSKVTVTVKNSEERYRLVIHQLTVPRLPSCCATLLPHVILWQY